MIPWTPPSDGETSFTVSCVDSLFGQRVNDGSYPTMEAAIDGAYATMRRLPKSAYRFKIHQTAPGWSVINESDVIFELIASRIRAPR